MTTRTVTEADIRWRNWLARGAETDLRTTRRMTGLLLLTAVSLGLWLFVTLVVR